MERDVCEHFEPIALCERCKEGPVHHDHLPAVTDEMVRLACRAFDRAGSKATVGNFENAIRAALEAAFYAPSNP